MTLPVCICGDGKIAAEHTLDIHDALTGECRSISNGSSCPCTHFRDSGRTVEVSER